MKKSVWKLLAIVALGTVGGCQDGLLGVDSAHDLVECQCQVTPVTPQEYEDAATQVEPLIASQSVCDPIAQIGCQAHEQCVIVRYRVDGPFSVACIDADGIAAAGP